MVATPGAELRLMLLVTRALPRFRGAGVPADLLQRMYMRKDRRHVLSLLEGYQVELDPAQPVENDLLFCPQLYDYREIAFVRANLADGDVFLDVGAHVGYYSLVASRRVGVRGLAVAIEADASSHRRLAETIERNAIGNITAIHRGVSDREEVLSLHIQTSGRAANSFRPAVMDGPTIPVKVACSPLLSILKEAGIDRATGMKVDIEGFDFRVLKRFLSEAPPAMRPRFVIVEHIEKFLGSGDGDPIQLLREHGYVVQGRTRRNALMRAAPPGARSAAARSAP